jgi:hypothetical protein
MITESQFKVADLSMISYPEKSVAPETALYSPVKSSACWNSSFAIRERFFPAP